MNMFPAPLQRLHENALAWAATQPDIRAVILVGSYARHDHPADARSDLDTILYTTEPERYRTCEGWIKRFGRLWVSVPFDHSGRGYEHLAIYEGGHKLDFAFFPLDRLAGMVAEQGLDEVLARGYVVLLDKDGLAAQLPPAPGAPLPIDPPAAGTFLSTIELFWYTAAQIGKHLSRGQLWVAKATDVTLHRCLLTMIEWHAHALHGPKYDTWVEGRFMAEWTDAATWRDLHDVFSHFDAADSWRALFAAMDLFRRLARETAARLGTPYPADLDGHITQFVRRLHAEAAPPSGA